MHSYYFEFILKCNLRNTLMDKSQIDRETTKRRIVEGFSNRSRLQSIHTVTTQAENPAGLSFGVPSYVENPHLVNVLLNPNRIVVADRLLHIAGRQPGR